MPIETIKYERIKLLKNKIDVKINVIVKHCNLFMQIIKYIRINEYNFLQNYDLKIIFTFMYNNKSAKILK